MSTTFWAMFGTATLICETAPIASGAFCVDQPSGVQDVQARLVDRDARVGDPFAVAAQVGERLAERDALGRAPAGQLERQLGQTDQAHAVVDAPGPEARLSDREGLPGPADDRARLAGARR